MKKRLFVHFCIAASAVLFLIHCENPTDPPKSKVVNIATIQGVTAPATGERPVTVITESAQYSGMVTWSPSHSVFAATTQYTATITLTTKDDFTLKGVKANFFTVAGATSVNNANSGVITAVFPATDATVINIAALQGLSFPANGATPVTAITANEQYSGTVMWFPGHSTFAAATEYMATITLTPKTGYTLQGVGANFFTVAGATSVTNAANSGVITAVFTATGGTIENPVKIDTAVIGGVTAPVTGAAPATTTTETPQYTGTVTWSPNHSTFAAAAQYTATITLTAKTGYTLQGVNANFFTVAGAVSVNSAANSGVITAVFPMTDATSINSVSITITAPVLGAAPGTAASGTGNFDIGEVSWSPTDNPFRGGVVYTAAVTLTANSSYTFTGLSSANINGQSAARSNNTGAAVTLSYIFPETDTRTVTNIAIKTPPNKLTYTHGDTLDLTGLVLTLTHDDATTEDVAAANFTAKNITANPAQGVNLAHSTHNGTPVTITYGSLSPLTIGNLTVNPKVTAFTVDAIPAHTYTGSPIQPAVTVKDGTTTLTLTTNYTVTYANNTNAGTATVTVTGAGNYSGSSGSKTFTINKATPTAADFDISGTGMFTFDGSAKTVTITPKAGKSTGTITVKYNGSTTAPSAAGTYTVTFDVAEAANFNTASGLSAGTLTIGNATPTAADFDISGTGTFTYDGTAKTVTITPKAGKSTGTITIKYGSNNTTAPSVVGNYTITFDVAASTGWNAASGLSAGTLTIGNAIPVAADFNIGNLTQKGRVTAVTITPKSGKSGGAITIYYEGIGSTTYDKSTTLPTKCGTYAVTFNVAAATNWNAANGLSVGTLIYEPFTSVSELRTYLYGLPTNTTATAYIIALNINNTDDFATLNVMLNDATNKYVYLDLSGSTITTIPDRAFTGCRSLTSITIPDSVTSIGNNAFSYCTGLTSITIPNSVTSIGNSAFTGCRSLTSVTIGNSVTSIGNSAFSGCTGLTSVTIGNSVKSIGDSAFSGCTGLTSVTIGNSVTSIGNSAFGSCTGLTSVTIGNSVKSIGDSAFYGCTGLTSVTIPNSVTSIGYQAFYGCTGLTSVTIPNSVTSIGIYAFYGCTGLTSVTIPNSVTSIGGLAFAGTSNLKNITIKTDKVTYTPWNNLGSNFSANDLVVTFEDVTYISSYAFYGCIGLTSVTIPDSVTSIGNSAFYDCRGLTSVTIPNSVTSIEDRAFDYCTSLTSVTIGNSVKSIGDWAFHYCTSLTSVTIGNSVKSIGDWAFHYCTSLTAINVATDNSAYTAENGVLYNKSKTTLIQYPAGKTETSFTIPNSVTSIGIYAFYGCTGLTSVTIPNSVTSIGNSAFYGCRGLTSVTIPNSVTSIGDSAFYGCTGLTSVTIGNSVKSIGDWAFDYCTSLTAINVATDNSAYTAENGVLYNKSKTTLIQYPAGKTGISFTIPNSVTSIGDSAFYGCRGLTSVTIPNSVTSIGDSAFSGCTGLTSVTIPNSVTSIGIYAFYGCTSLTSVTIPNSVTSIGVRAFGYCTGLTSVTFSTGSAITSANFDSEAFPQGSDSNDGDNLRTAYLSGGAGTYTRTSGGETWSKQ